MGKAASPAVLLFSFLLLALVPLVSGQPQGCVCRLELASGNLTAGSPVSFYFTNQGTNTVTLRSTAPWLVRETGSDGPVTYVAVGAGVIQEVTPGNRYPVSGAWSWTPDRDGDYYVELTYECAGVYPLLAHLHVNVSAAGIPEFPSSWMLVVTVAVALGVALSLVQKPQRHQSDLMSPHLAGAYAGTSEVSKASAKTHKY
jgi:hypothetical protein